MAISLLPEQRKSYDRAEVEGVIHLKQLGRTVRIQHVLELITRLKQICNADPETGESSKLVDVRERLAILANEGNRALIFSQYTDQTFGVAAIADALEDFRPLRFTGDMSTSERDQVIQSFKNNPQHKALVLSLRAGGVGLNLQDASYVFHIDRWWNPAVERQAEDRSHRYGQVVPVHVFKYMCIGTIEERIDAILEQKQRLFDEIVDDVSVNIGTHLTSEELFGLFGVEAPARDDRMRGPSGLDLEDRCAGILRNRGWNVERTPSSRGGGVDVIGRRTDEVGIAETVYVQCHDHARPVGVTAVRELLGIIPAGGNIRVILATPAGVTADAAQLAKERGVMIWDKARLSDLDLVP
jgi:hypothetical protein